MGQSAYEDRDNDRSASPRAEFDGQQYFARLEGGHDWTIGRWSLGPVASVQYLYSHQDAFTESIGPLGLHIDDRDADSLQSGLGLRSTCATELAGTRLLPSARLEWIHEYLNDERPIDARVGSFPGEPRHADFTVYGDAPTRDTLVLSAGLDTLLTPALSLFLHYDLGLPLDGPDLVSHALFAGLHYRF